MPFRPAVRGGGVFSPANRVVPGLRAPARSAPINPIAQRRTQQVQRVQQQLGLPQLNQPAPAPQPVAAPILQLLTQTPVPEPAPYVPPEVTPGQRPTPGELSALGPVDVSLPGPAPGIMPGAYIPPEVTPGQRPRPDQLNMGGQSMMPNMGGFDPAQLFNQYSTVLSSPSLSTLSQIPAAEPTQPSVFNPTQPTVG